MRHLPGLLGSLAAILIATTALAGQSVRIVPDSQLMPMPAAGFDRSGAALLRDSPNVVIPTTLLYLSIRGSARASSQGTRSGSMVTMEYDVRGLERATVEEVALFMRIDLADRLRDRGMTIVHPDTVAANPILAGIERFQIDTNFHAPTVRDEARKVTYAIVALADSLVFDRGRERSLAAFRALAKELNAAVVIPELWFDAPQLHGKRDFVPGAYSARVTVSQGMDLVRASLTIITASGAVGSIALKQPLAALSDNVGEVTRAGADSSRFGSLNARDLRIVGASGMIGAATGRSAGGNAISDNHVIFVPSATAYSRALLRGAASFFQAIAVAVDRR